MRSPLDKSKLSEIFAQPENWGCLFTFGMVPLSAPRMIPLAQPGPSNDHARKQLTSPSDPKASILGNAP